MKTKTLFFIVLSWVSINAYAQFDPRTQLQPPSAEAQDFNKYSEIPVDLHTGRVDINIPLYTVQHQDIIVPISLSYHGGGIKVTDECGAVGLGWALQAGGVISRIVRGLPDEMYTANTIAGYNRLSELTLKNTLHNFDDFINLVRHRESELEPYRWTSSPITDNNELYEMDMMAKYGEEYDNGRFETSPDNYIFQVQNLSGAFVNKRNTIIMQTGSPCSLNRKKDFVYEIQDADGFHYVFDKQERQEYTYKVGYGWGITNWESLLEQQYVYPSAWWLSKIISAKGDSIIFRYEEKKIVHEKAPWYGYTQLERRQTDNSFRRDTRFYSFTQEHMDTTFHQLLKTIETPLCKVIFYYENNDSVTRYPQLDSIHVYALSDLQHPIESWKFTYSGDSDRSRLTELIHYGANREEQHYAFTYNSSSSVMLNDQHRDHWGYFAPESRGRFPYKTYFSFPFSGYDSNYTERYADNSTACNNMLSSITYPLGYKVNFDWEPHTFSQFGERGNRAHKEYDYNPQTSTSTPTTIYRKDYVLALCGKERNEVLQVQQTIHRPSKIRINLSDYYKNIITHDDPDVHFKDCIGNWNCNTDISPRPLLTIHKNNSEIFSTEICCNTIDEIVELSDSAGNYVFTLSNPRAAVNEIAPECSFYMDEYFNRATPNESPDGYIHIEIGHEEEVEEGQIPEGTNIRNVGGVRIKRITYQSNNTSLLTKEYYYIKGDSQESSGVLAYPPRYGSQAYFCESEHLNNPEGAGANVADAPSMLTLRSEGLPFVLNGDGHIEYTRVVEDVVETSGAYNNAARKPMNRTVYEFYTAFDSGCDDVNDTGREHETMIPTDMLQLTSYSFRRGHLKQKIEYSDEIKTTDYTYDIPEAANVDTLTGSLFTIADYTENGNVYNYQGNSVSPYKDIGIVQYRLIPYNKRIKKVNVTGDITNASESYSYKTANYSSARNANLPTQHSVVGSDGDTITEYISYLDETSKIQTHVTVRNGRVVDACRYEYDEFLQVKAKYVAPLSIDSLPPYATFNVQTAANVLQESFEYYGNRLVEYIDHQHGKKVAWLWSYANAYPIAEIENVDFQTILTTLGENKVNQLQASLSPNMEQVDNLRSTFPNGRITTMTYYPLRGIRSYTDIRGETTYYDYDGFGQLTEAYRLVNGTKQILEHYEYHWSY